MGSLIPPRQGSWGQTGDSKDWLSEKSFSALSQTNLDAHAQLAGETPSSRNGSISSNNSLSNVSTRDPTEFPRFWAGKEDEWPSDAKGPFDHDKASQNREVWTPLASGSLTSFIEGWLKTTVKAPVIKLVSPENFGVLKNDIDTTTGIPVDLLEHPESFANRLEGPCRNTGDIAWRALNMSSAIGITQELNRRKRVAEQVRRKLEDQKENKVIPQAEEDDWPKAACQVRPAMASDFEAIAAIMNMEADAEVCPQVIEVQPIKASDIQNIYDHCARTHRPFVVAKAEDELSDKSKWPKGSEKAFLEYMKFRKSRPVSTSIVGFAFVTEAGVGLTSSSSAASRFSGRITLIVHPEHRRNMYGTALLDRVLLSVTPYHRSVVDYKWECPSPLQVYEYPATKNQQQYAQVFIDISSIGKDSPDFASLSRLLEKFDFRQVAYLPKVRRTNKQQTPQWLDLSTWQLDARPLAEIDDLE